jgi:hypothetical protein
VPTVPGRHFSFSLPQHIAVSISRHGQVIMVILQQRTPETAVLKSATYTMGVWERRTFFNCKGGAAVTWSDDLNDRGYNDTLFNRRDLLCWKAEAENANVKKQTEYAMDLSNHNRP